MSVQAHPSPDAIDVTNVFGALRRSLRTIIMLSLLTGVVAFGVFAFMKPIYTSEAQIAILARWEANPFADPQKDGGGDTVSVRMDREAINTHVRALQAPDLAQKIIDELKLAERPEFAQAGGGMISRLRSFISGRGPTQPANAGDQVLTTFQKKLQVFPTKESRAISVQFSSNDRDLAATVANLVAERYRDTLASRTIVESGDVQKALVPRIEELKKETSAADAEVERFRAAANMFRGGAQINLNEQQLSELTAAESKARTELSEAEARARAAAVLLKKGVAEGLPDVQRSPNMQKLIQDRARIEADIAKAKATMKEGHPIVKQMRAEQKEVEQQLRVEIKRVVESLEKEVGVAKLRLDAVRAGLSETKTLVASTGADKARLAQLEANARAKRGELERLQAQYEANRARADRRVVPVAVQIISKARPAAQPSFPKPAPFAGLAALATFLLATAVSLVRALAMGARGAGSSAVEIAPAAPVARKRATATPAAAEPVPEPVKRAAATSKSAVHEAVQKIAGLGGPDRSVRTLVAGATPSISAAECALAICNGLADGGAASVLLIDMSNGADSLARAAGVLERPGAGELLAGEAGFETVIRPLPGAIVQLMPAGADLAGALVRCDVDRLNLLLDVLDEAYAYVVVAGPHALACALFEALEGRFDMGVVVDSAWRRAAQRGQDDAGTFLGFEVAGLEIVHVSMSQDGEAVAGARKANRPARGTRAA